MNNKFLVLSALVVIIFISGCTQLSSFSGVSALDVIEHPEKYYEKSVTLTEYPSINLMHIYYPDLRYIISEKNEEGKPLSMMMKYDQFYCIKCEITGTIKSFKACNCQKRTFVAGSPAYHSIEDVPWRIYDPLNSVLSIDMCQKDSEEIKFGLHYEKSEYRCEPNSERDIYYFDITKVKALD